MKRSQWIAMAALVVVGLAFGYLALHSRQPPILPPDADHAGATNTLACLGCHGRDEAFPRSVNHPIGDDCFRCHGKP